ncbi:hypothetical protein CYMTET_12999 [Cymbomonas tetramitiformis]|uniref:Uncharacterized protein n=1 Tax=Cymbomonas tetramitiformis TaxID=36881 RepID=A0AAE0BQE6_9CHLO|nr:hypothetical protein CYMTET_49374 [Cymbomonas tetramitiformis]KAK3279097.1 hypothetical protein CYMTET_12999 [Cymbomonas tetramitiformis]
MRFEATYLLLTSKYITNRWNKYPYKESRKEDRTFLRLGTAQGTLSSRRDELRQYVIEAFSHLEYGRLLSRLNQGSLMGSAASPHQIPLYGQVPGLAQLPTAPATAGEGSGGSSTPATPNRRGPCPLCGGPHAYRTDAYDHPADVPITKQCNRVRSVNGVRKKCVKLHAFSGPLATPCEPTETVA